MSEFDPGRHTTGDGWYLAAVLLIMPVAGVLTWWVW